LLLSSQELWDSGIKVRAKVREPDLKFVFVCENKLFFDSHIGVEEKS